MNPNVQRLRKAVYCIELRKEWPTIKSCAEELKLDRSNLIKCLKGKHQTCGGYHFEYKD